MNATPIVENPTTEILLRGIKIAATIGDKCPETAKLNPIMLYMKEITKAAFKTVMELLDN